MYFLSVMIKIYQNGLGLSGETAPDYCDDYCVLIIQLYFLFFIYFVYYIWIQKVTVLYEMRELRCSEVLSRIAHGSAIKWGKKTSF